MTTKDLLDLSKANQDQIRLAVLLNTGSSDTGSIMSYGKICQHDDGYLCEHRLAWLLNHVGEVDLAYGAGPVKLLEPK